MPVFQFGFHVLELLDPFAERLVDDVVLFPKILDHLLEDDVDVGPQGPPGHQLLLRRFDVLHRVRFPFVLRYIPDTNIAQWRPLNTLESNPG